MVTYDVGDILVSNKDCPYLTRGGKYKVARKLPNGLINLFILEHKKNPEQRGRMFKAKPEFFDKVEESKPEEKESFGEKMANIRKGKKEKESEKNE